MLNDYLRRELGFKDDRIYERQAEVFPWSTEGDQFRYPNLSEALRQKLKKEIAELIRGASGRRK